MTPDEMRDAGMRIAAGRREIEIWDEEIELAEKKKAEIAKRNQESRHHFNPSGIRVKKRFNITLTQEVIDYLKDFGGGNASLAIERLVIIQQARQSKLSQN